MAHPRLQWWGWSTAGLFCIDRASTSALFWGQGGARKRDSLLTGMELQRAQSSEITKR